MEGFVNTGVQTPYLDGMKHNICYAKSGVNNIAEQNQTQNLQNQQNTYVREPYHLQQNLLSGGNNLLGQSYYSTFTDFDKTVVDTVVAPNQSGKQRMYAALAIGGSVVTLGGITLAVTRGKLPKALTGAMSKVMDKINKKTEQIKQKPSMSRLEGTYLSVLQGINKAAYKIRGAIFNISPLKDVLFDKLVRQKCGLQKPCDAITNAFRKLSFGTVKSSYKKASGNIDEMSKIFDETNARLASGSIEGAKPVEKGDLKSIVEKTGNIRKLFDESFTEKALQQRSDELVQTFDGLGSRVYNRIYGNVKDFVKDVNEWTSFVPEILVAKDKSLFMAKLAEKRKLITNNPENNYHALTEILTTLENTINPSHKESREIVKSLRDLSKRYVSASGENEAAIRTKINSMINNVLKSANKTSQSEIYSEADSKKILSLLRQYGKVVNTDKKGYIEEILSYYKEVLPPAEYAKVKKSAQKTVDSLNKAVHNEGFEYVDKLRDLATGSALTDVAIGMGVPVIATGAAVSVADTKEKKQSVVLKYGIPLLVGIATTTISTVKLISGGKSLMLGALTSTIANEICERIDKKLKSNNSKSSADEQNMNNVETK